jgi:transposase
MSNQLKMADIQSILSLHLRGWKQRRIARELGIDRETVSRHVKAAAEFPATDSKPAISPNGNGEPSADPSFVIAPIGVSEILPVKVSPAGRPSDCELWREIILAKWMAGLSLTRIHYDLQQEHGATVSYDSVRRFMRRENRKQPLPFRRMEVAPGDEAQIDFGSGAPVISPEGKRRRPHVFRFVLSHSRKGYSEASYRQTTEDFLRCMENAFWAFGGVPKVLVIDNLRAAVKQPDWYDPELNPILYSFCDYYGVAILPTKSRTPRHKGKIERGVGYVQGHALKCKTFPSLEEENRHLWAWEETVADTRIHGTTRKQVGQVFADIERSALQPLPRERFPFFHESQRVVHRDGHVSVAKAYYSVPPEYLGQTVWARWDSRLVRLFNHRREQIAVHPRQEPGKFSTLALHIPKEKISGQERGAHWLLSKICLIGPHSLAWAEAMLSARGLPGVRVLQGLLCLANRYSHEDLEKVCETAHASQAYHLRPLRQLLKRQADAPQQQILLQVHDIIRPLEDYSAWLAETLRRDQGNGVRESNGSAGFMRDDEGVRGKMKKGPRKTSPAGPSTFSTRPRSEYPLSGCSSAEPDSVSSDRSIVPSPFPVSKEILP